VLVEVNHLATVNAKLEFSDIRSSLGSVDAESGTSWTLAGQANLVDRQFISNVRAGVDRGLALSAGHSSIWFREAAGFSPHDRDNPFANFFFGGFGNNYVDRGDEKRYRQYYSLPGLELNEIGGRNFVKSMVEVNLPPVRFLHLGTPGFYIPWMRPAAFVTGLATNLDDPASRRVVLNTGAQVDFRFAVLSVLDLTLSAGGAVAFEEGRPPRREAMISLKVLR
jgi:hypothetical protein